MSTPAAILDAVSDGDSSSGAAAARGPNAKTAGSGRREKKRDKVRSAWISFAGRIVAQLMGAAATVGLGVLFVHNFAPPRAQVATLGQTEAVRPVAVRAPRPAGQLTVAVLPIQNLSGESSREFLADGMTESLIAALAQVPGVHVVSRTSSMHYKTDRRAVSEIAGELGADFVVEGSLVESRGRVRVIAQFIDARHDDHLWARHYDGNADDVIALQARVSGAIAADLQPTFLRLQGHSSAADARPRTASAANPGEAGALAALGTPDNGTE